MSAFDDWYGRPASSIESAERERQRWAFEGGVKAERERVRAEIEKMHARESFLAIGAEAIASDGSTQRESFKGRASLLNRILLTTLREDA